MTTKLIILAGYPGVGKTFVATQISKQTDGTVFRSDAIRKELFPDPTYSKQESEKTYSELFSRAEKSLKSNTVTIIDATFNLKIGRDSATEIAQNQDCEVLFIKVTCDENTVRKRIENRDGLSDADFSVYQKVRDSFEPIEKDFETIDNSNTKKQTKEQIKTILSKNNLSN